MTRLQQFYGGVGVPMTVPSQPDEVASAWRSQRRRLRSWFAGLDDDAWTEKTRCSEWDVTDLAQHLVSGAQFLGFTLHEANKGRPTRLLEGFDPQQTPGAAAGLFRGLSSGELVTQLGEMDASVDSEIDRLTGEGGQNPAEAPLGQVPAYVAVNHFLFDSWVHEYDLMLPAGRTPVLVPEEALVVATYVLALSGVAHAVDDGQGAERALHVHLTDLDRDLVVAVDRHGCHVEHSEAGGRCDVVATTPALLDFATGRTSALRADAEAVVFLQGLATLMG